MAVTAILFLWIIAAIANYIGKTRKLTALGITFLLAILFVFIANAILSKMIGTSFLDICDIFCIFILLILAFISFIFAKAK